MTKKDQAQRSTSEVKETSGGFAPIKFLNETKEELKKVVWPSRQQLISESAAVVLMVSLVTALIYLFDKFFIWIAERVFG
ncbi:MAG: preprotein translocase subunit SecE [Cyanobacteria bacterium QH_8_48_120]|nr:MAG: preprotein translocase subunit SecE [Cyanobacteria bacterium QH_1_48_107]PSO55983.1 MAG: preprotein translocase subunit SecE [Cyanobacteria bacterium QH_10_48_56]PSO58106.1 MAG: preprotein translocase subunit SecE [Cyanobacteria bacterium QH_7_48_89]PSO67432.1 MAG: preprotein translocase subunit SecE [Cyanobacteria bacterium QH_6_48_35]PSO69697.1 MAG: preprotein translocase subunit SecE [Cyanobacteria bacterium QS_1_48_34]PSO71179.1 MAG: preprotein translocase subunit SecE [Cyanobacter